MRPRAPAPAGQGKAGADYIFLAVADPVKADKNKFQFIYVLDGSCLKPTASAAAALRARNTTAAGNCKLLQVPPPPPTRNLARHGWR
jgi:hypothetical protein